jgi:NADPH:quinone reductase
MHAWLCESLDGIAAMPWRELPTPEPQPGEVRIAVRCASLNFPDLLIVEGKYQFKPALPFVPGAEFSGTVEALGEGVKHLQVGQAVAALGSHGGFATQACVPARNVLPLPAGMPFEDGAAFAFAYGTSYHTLMDRAALRGGEKVLVPRRRAPRSSPPPQPPTRPISAAVWVQTMPLTSAPACRCATR